MPDEYVSLVTALKTLQQEEDPGTTESVMITLPMAENEWYTRPDAVSYGTVSIDFESDRMNGDGQKIDTSYSGSVDLFSLSKNGAGWVNLITETLNEHCGASWSLNSHTYERETQLFHWEWTFEVVG